MNDFSRAAHPWESVFKNIKGCYNPAILGRVMADKMLINMLATMAYSLEISKHLFNIMDYHE